MDPTTVLDTAAQTPAEVVFTVEGEGEAARRVATVAGRSLAIFTGRGEGEPRARDLDIAAWLEFSQPRMIRKLIKRHVEARNVAPFEVRSTVSQTGGRPGTEYWLTEPDALFIATQSETPKAVAVTREMIRVFIAVRRGLEAAGTATLPGSSDPTPEPLPGAPFLAARELALLEHAAGHDARDLALAILRTEALERDASLTTARQVLGALGSAALVPLVRLLDAMALGTIETPPPMVGNLVGRIRLITAILETVAEEFEARGAGDEKMPLEQVDGRVTVPLAAADSVSTPDPAPDTLSLVATIPCTAADGTSLNLAILGWQGRQWILQTDLARLFCYPAEAFPPITGAIPRGESTIVSTRELLSLRMSLASTGGHPSLDNCQGVVRRLLTPAGVVALASRVSAASGVVEALCGAWRMVAG